MVFTCVGFCADAAKGSRNDAAIRKGAYLDNFDIYF
jgi:hypothetical protein